MTDVSQETITGAAKYVQYRSRRTRERMIAGVIAHAGQGNYRPTAAQIGQYANISDTAVRRHFGSVDLLCRVVAREHWRALSLPIEDDSELMDQDRKALAWALLVGAPRDV